MNRFVQMAVNFILLTLTTTSVQADIFEPFSTSNLNPFIQPIGLPTVRSAEIAKKGNLSWQLHVDTANNFSTSTNDTERILIDGESYRSTAMVRYGISDRWEVTVAVPYLRHTAGSFDSPIENWHKFLGLPNGGRGSVPQDQLNYQYQRGTSAPVNLSRPVAGIGDIRLGVGYPLADHDSRAWTLRAGVKLPTGEAGKFTGSEGTDVYASLHFSNRALFDNETLAMHSMVGLLVPGSGDLLDGQVEDWVIFGSGGIGWRIRDRISLKGQIDYHSAVYDSGLKELGNFSAQLVFGGSIKFGLKTYVDIAVSEDIITDTSPDVVLQIGIRTAL